MIRVGLTGSMAAGKSEVSRVLRENGVPVFDADATVHELYADGTVAALLPDAFAEAISGHKVDRASLSRLLGDNPRLFPLLESIVHPLVHQREADFFAAALARQESVAVADLPLLVETGRDRQFDAIILVCAPEDQRRTRALARPGMTPEKYERITARQRPEEDKRRRATHVIENDSTLEVLRARTSAVLSAIRKMRT